jgi:hypothetical protein
MGYYDIGTDGSNTMIVMVESNFKANSSC